MLGQLLLAGEKQYPPILGYINLAFVRFLFSIRFYGLYFTLRVYIDICRRIRDTN